MKKWLKKVGAGIVLPAMLALTACGGFTARLEDVPQYEDAEPFRFVAYMGPPPANSGSGEFATNPDYMTLENYQIMADCGFNYTTGMYENTKELYLKGLDLAQQVGMKYYVRDYSFTDGCIEGIIAAANSEEEAQAMLEQQQVSIKARFEEYSEYESFAGVLAVVAVSVGIIGENQI